MINETMASERFRIDVQKSALDIRKNGSKDENVIVNGIIDTVRVCSLSRAMKFCNQKNDGCNRQSDDCPQVKYIKKHKLVVTDHGKVLDNVINKVARDSAAAREAGSTCEK